ncbi:uncharacterized protein isoform X2 [Rhodnius prolixus]|uniref:uncharacterized protein isoform X2 n=1 Tax=Rhodnius prolixus TaxID=13249 RepID=UPI003D18BF0C
MSTEPAESSAPPAAEQSLVDEECEVDEPSEKRNEIVDKESVNGETSEEENEKEAEEKDEESKGVVQQPPHSAPSVPVVYVKEQNEVPVAQPTSWRPSPHAPSQSLNWPRQQPRPPLQQHPFPIRPPPPQEHHDWKSVQQQPPQQQHLEHPERKTVQFATPPAQRLPHPGLIRRISPWAVLRAKLPPDHQFLRRGGPDFPILRMQSPDTLEMNGPQRTLSGGPNGMGSRPQTATRGPPPSQMTRPPSQESHPSGMSSPDPRSVVRSPYLQRSDSPLRSPMPDQRNVNQRVPPSISRPPSRSSTLRSSVDDDDDVVMTSQSRPQSGTGQRPVTSPQTPQGMRLPQQMPGKVSPTSNSEVPPTQSRPPSRATPPQSPSLAGLAARSPLPDRQSNLSSLKEEIKTTNNVDIPKLDPSKTDSDIKTEISKLETANLEPAKTDSLVTKDKTIEDINKTESVEKEDPKNEASKLEKHIAESVVADSAKQEIKKSETNTSEVLKSDPPKLETSKSDQPKTSDVQKNETIKTNHLKQDTTSPELSKPITFKSDDPKSSESIRTETPKLDNGKLSNSSTPVPSVTRPVSRSDTVVKESAKMSTVDEKKINEKKETNEKTKETKEISKKIVNGDTFTEGKVSSNKKTNLKTDESKISSPKRPTILKSSSPNVKAEKSNSNVTNETAAAHDNSGPKEAVVNGGHESPKKSPSKVPPAAPKKLATAQSPMKSPNKAASPKTPDTPSTAEKKMPMNKVQVGAAPSPNLKTIKSKIGSLENAKHKPGGGNIKIESRKLNFKVQPKIEAKNDTYTPGGGDKKIQSVKLQWNAKPKVGSLDNAAHKPGGGDKKIESVKLDFKDKAKPKVGSKDNIKHVAGGGSVKNSTGSQEGNPSDIEDQKLEIKAQSKIGSLDNVKHKPGGGDKKIYDDKTYLKQMAGSTSDINSTPNQGKKDSRRNSSTARSKSTEPKMSTREISNDGLRTPDTKPTDQNFNQLNEKNTQGVVKLENQLIQNSSEADKTMKSSETSDNQLTKKSNAARMDETKDENKKDANGNGKLDLKTKETNFINSTHVNKNNSLKTEEEIKNKGDDNLQTSKENLATSAVKSENGIILPQQSSKGIAEISDKHLNNSSNNQDQVETKSSNLPEETNSDESVTRKFVLVDKFGAV